MTEMHDVVEMLLTRIKDYPEDFVDAPSNNVKLYGDTSSWTKWKDALHTAYQVATDEEKLALDEATTDAKRAIYMGAALKTVMMDEGTENQLKDADTIGSKKYSLSRSQMAAGLNNSNGILTTAAMRVQAQRLLDDTIRNEYQNATNNA